MINGALVRLDGILSGMYACSAKGGRPSVAPEKLLRAVCCMCSTASVGIDAAGAAVARPRPGNAVSFDQALRVAGNARRVRLSKKAERLR